jgi:hypothetical protein
MVTDAEFTGCICGPAVIGGIVVGCVGIVALVVVVLWRLNGRAAVVVTAGISTGPWVATGNVEMLPPLEVGLLSDSR